MKQCDPASKQEPGASWSKSPGSPTPSMSADQAASSPLLPLNSAGLSQGDVSRQDEAVSPGASHVDGLGPKPADAQAKQISKEPPPAPFVPFSGGGQRLGGPSGSARPLMSSSAKLPKSFSSPAGPSKPKKSKPGQEPQPEPEPVRGELGWALGSFFLTAPDLVAGQPRVQQGHLGTFSSSQGSDVLALFCLKLTFLRHHFRCTVDGF